MTTKSDRFRQMGNALFILSSLIPPLAASSHAGDGAHVTIVEESDTSLLLYAPHIGVAIGWEKVWRANPPDASTTGSRAMSIGTVYLVDKTIVVASSAHEFYFRGVDARSGVVVTPASSDKEVAARMADAIENDVASLHPMEADFLLRVLGLLGSWPENMPLLMWKSPEEVVAAIGPDTLYRVPREVFDTRSVGSEDVRTLDMNELLALELPTVVSRREGHSVEPAAPDNWVSLCGLVDTGSYQGWYYNRRYKKIPYMHSVGGSDCFGRCWIGCKHQRKFGMRYTVDCFNHDACVTKWYYTFEPCNLMFTYCADDTLYAPNCTSAGTVSGRVVDAINGSALLGTSVGIDGTSTSALTDSNGNYSLTISPGSYNVSASKNGYVTLTQPATVSGGQNTAVNFALSPVGSAGDMRIVLTWGATPPDLDSHLWLPPSNPFHVYYSNKGTTSAFPYAQLDLDDTTAFGPETTSIVGWYSGTYRFAIYDYSGSNSGSENLTTSGGRAQIYLGSSLVATYDVSTSGSGLWWYVFDVDGDTHSITPRNYITSTYPGPYMPSSEAARK